MERLEEIKRLASICGSGRVKAVGDFFTLEDVDYMLSLIDRYKTALERARDKTQVLASHCAYVKGIGYNLDAQDTFEKSQAIYELLRGALEKEVDKMTEPNVSHVELEYPNVHGNKDTIEVNMTSVRASDGVRLKYDFNRDGWEIYKPRVTHPYISDGSYGYHEEWVEVAYISSWMFDTYFIEKDGTKRLKED